jgi:hypothetical protein
MSCIIIKKGKTGAIFLFRIVINCGILCILSLTKYCILKLNSIFVIIKFNINLKTYEMKTIADFKRRLVIGAKVHTTFHQAGAGRDENNNLVLKDEDKGVREVSIVQTNSFAFKTTKADGTITDSWCNYPKSKEAIFINENTIQILSPDFRVRNSDVLIPCLTYTFL